MSEKKILFRDHNAYLVTSDWDSKKHKIIYNETPITRLVPYLGYAIEFGRKFLFRDLWTFIAEDTDTLEQIFRANLGSYPLAPYVAESKKESKEKIPDLKSEGIHYLEFFTCKELTTPTTGRNYYSEYTGIHGVGLGKHNWTKTPNKLVREQYSLSFSKMNDLLDYPLQLCDKNELHMTNMKKLKKHKKGVSAKKWRDSYLTTLDLGDAEYRLYDVLGALFHEISFFGLPDERDDKAGELDEQIKQLDLDKLDGIDKKGVNKKTGKKVFYSSAEVFKNLREDRKKREAKAKLEAPKLIKRYTGLLKKHKDTEILPVKKFYMENRGNEDFRRAADKLNKQVSPI